MAIIQNRKADKAVSDLLSRQEYLITQANDLARSFGNLTTFQHKVLDFCFTYVKADDSPEKVYKLDALTIIRQFGLGTSGSSYVRVAKAFKALNENTAIYMRIKKDGHSGIMMTSLFDYISILDDGQMEFKFSTNVAPYVFQLKKRFYSFKLSDLSRVRSKYTLTLMKLWNANSMGKLSDVCIQGTLEEWESWFIGSDENGKPKHWSAGVFRRDVLNRAMNELGELYPKTLMTLTVNKSGRKVVGYQLNIHLVQTNMSM